MKHYFALLDCNNFYVSCERVFNPRLAKRPVVVLSNNDGCVISRSQEAKDMGIRMGMPFFECRELCRSKKVLALSSNYTLYGDMSQRVVETLSQFNYPLEIYSIDEVFLELPQLDNGELSKICFAMRERVLKSVGIPISIGVSYTKTLAKLANKEAKSKDGVSLLLQERDLELALERSSIADVWGIGRQLAAKFKDRGVFTAGQLRDLGRSGRTKGLNVVVRRTIRELDKEPCLSLELVQNQRKSIACTRSFGKRVETLEQLQEAVATYTAKAARRLREEQLEAETILLFLVTDRFRSANPYRTICINLAAPTADTFALVAAAGNGLKSIFVEGLQYSKAGVVFNNLSSACNKQEELFCSQPKTKSNKKMLAAIDSLNRRWGKDTVFVAAEGINKVWSMKQEMLSKRFTTEWDELLTVKLG